MTTQNIINHLTETKATRREWIGLAVLALPTLLVSMDMTVLYLAVPSLSMALKPSNNQLLWITDIFGFAEAGFLITMGTLGDKIGRRKLLLIGAFAFTIASLFAAFSTSAAMLIAARGLLGVAGATLLPSTMSLISSMFHDDKQRTFAFGIWTTCFSGGTMLGPFVGGILLSHFWWGSVFLIASPIMVLLMVFGPIWLPEHKNPANEKFDLVSSGLSLLAILPFIYGIKEIAQDGFAYRSLIPVFLGFCVGVVFLKRQQKLNNPLIDLSLFRKTDFSVTLITLMLALFVWAGMGLFIAQHLQLVLGMSTLKAGMLTMPASAASAVSCMLAPQAVKIFRKFTVIISGLLIMILGAYLMSLIIYGSGLPLIITASILLSSGCGLIVTLAQNIAVSSVPTAKAGAAAGISETSAAFGSALGIAVLGSIGTVVYRHEMSNKIFSQFFVNSGELFNKSFGVAIIAIKNMPRQLSLPTLLKIRGAFVNSLNMAADVSLAILCATTIIAVYKFRDKRNR